MKYVSAVLLALAIVAAQVLHGGVRDPALSAPAYALLVLAAISAAFAVWRTPNPVTPGALAAVCVFGGYVLWRCVGAPDPFLARLDANAALTGLLAFVVAACGLPDVKSRFVLLGLLGLAAIVQSAVGIIQFAKGVDFTPLGWFSSTLQSFYQNRFSVRAHGFYLNPNQYAWLCGWAALTSLAVGCWGRISLITRIVLIYFALFFMGCDVLSGSRGGLLSLIAGLGAFILISVVAIFSVMKRGRFAFAAAALALTLGCAGAAWFVYSSNWMAQGRMDTLFVADVRSYLFEHAWRQFQTAPLLGAGPGMFLYAARLYRAGYQRTDAVYAHDDWIQTLAEYGVIGLGLAVLAVAVVLGGGLQRFFSTVQYRATHDDRPLSNSAAILIGALSALVMFIVHGTIDFNMHIPANALLGAAVLGLIASRESVADSRRIEIGVMRSFGFIALMTFAVATGLSLWRHGRADYETLQSVNALAKGDPHAALAHTDEGLKFAPNDAALLLARGRALFNFETAVELDSDALDSSDEDADEETEDELPPAEREKIYRSAAEALESVVAQRPMERTYRVELARALVELGEHRAAQKQFVEAIRLDPNFGYGYAAYGDYLDVHEELPAARAIFNLGRFTPSGDYSAQRFEAVTEEMSPSLDEDSDAFDDEVDDADTEKSEP